MPKMPLWVSLVISRASLRVGAGVNWAMVQG
eukprot:COSAG06_NODE_1869_length_8172_cov_3.579143_1_plen_31_part_00